VVLGGAGRRHAKGLMSINPDRMEGGNLWGTCCKGSVVLRVVQVCPAVVPQLSRTSLQLGHFKHNMQRMHTRLC
jgi:hypothetical protein